ncbi:MAG: 2-oxoglutarate dehydrogenase E1 component [Polyangiaceae bacterium]|nr:2-oxoglutarate dehydrogenase E1 component [Polyangiaceae bacterium]
MYEQYMADPASVPEDWHAYFQSLGPTPNTAGFAPSFRSSSIFNPPSPNGNGPNSSLAALSGLSKHSEPPQLEHPEEVQSNGLKHPPVGSLRPFSPESMDIAIRQDRVDQLVRAYRVRGHLAAKIDPLEMPRADVPELDPAFYRLHNDDLDRPFSSRTIYGTETLTLREIIQRMKDTYCRAIGVEFMHIHDLESKQWLQERMEGTENRLELDSGVQTKILTALTDAVILEEFIQKKYLGAKSFSLEGSESLIPLLHLAIDRASTHGVDEVTLGMAHRGRLNVLANIMGKHPRDIFREFDDVDPQLYRGRGDVKYHIGYSSDMITHSGNNVHLSLCFNPSHLEYVNTVVLGRVRAKQDRAGDTERSTKLALLIHGDAAFIGEGIVQETLNLSELRAYQVGGALHIIVNNQIGFTTPPSQSRSTTYATDIAKMLQCPIFHVNGEDPEAVAQVVYLAMDFRAKFQRDVVIDMYGYRRHGHNEGDEPAFTQPLLYRAIAKRKSVREGYLATLLKLGGISQAQGDQIATERKQALEDELSEARTMPKKTDDNWLGGYWQGYTGGPSAAVDDVPTGVDASKLRQLMLSLARVPSDFRPHKKIERLLQNRAEMGEGKRSIDWGAAEVTAFGSLVTEGYRVRMTGQDAGRGTFSHRHAVLYDYDDGNHYMPLAHISDDQAPIEVFNSCLSESGVMGFEWGYSLDWPDGLVVWEAQFGDFCNAAQVIIDQFIASAEDKWRRLSGLVLLLPHGFEGMGPEHSSARLERFLMLCAEDNMQIAQPTTPAQYFHLLRRQVLRPWRKPLIVFSPKSLLRHPSAVSTVEELSGGRFHRVLGESEPLGDGPVRRVLLCSGKIYYELFKHRNDIGRKDVAIVRMEQLYPLPKAELSAALEAYPNGTPVFWVQDEPENMGAWTFMRMKFGERMFGRFPLSVVAREESASPATGSARSHKIEQAELIDEAFGS